MADEAAPPSSGRRPGNLALGGIIGLLVAFAPMTIDLYLPAMPAMVAALDADISSVQLTLSVYMIGFAASQIFFGPLSDRYGRRPVIFAGTGIYIVASIACALAASVEQLIVFRLFQSVGAAVGPVVGRAVVRDYFTREDAARMLSFVSSITALAPILAPILGGLIATWLDWRANFWALTGFGATAMVLVALVLPESNRYRDPTATRLSRMMVNFATMLRQRAYVGYLLTIIGTFGGLFAFLIGGSFVLIDGMGLSEIAYGLSFGGASLGFLLGTQVGGRSVRRLGVERMCLVGTVFLALAGILMFALIWGGLRTPAAVIGPSVVYFFGIGMTQPNLVAGAVSPFPRMAGAASSLLGFAQYCGSGVAAVVLGLFAFEPTHLLATVMATAALFSLTTFTLLVWLPLRRAAD